MHESEPQIEWDWMSKFSPCMRQGECGRRAPVIKVQTVHSEPSVFGDSPHFLGDLEGFHSASSKPRSWPFLCQWILGKRPLGVEVGRNHRWMLLPEIRSEPAVDSTGGAGVVVPLGQFPADRPRIRPIFGGLERSIPHQNRGKPQTWKTHFSKRSCATSTPPAR